jgi:hypothetical protein
VRINEVRIIRGSRLRKTFFSSLLVLTDNHVGYQAAPVRNAMAGVFSRNPRRLSVTGPRRSGL